MQRVRIKGDVYRQEDRRGVIGSTQQHPASAPTVAPRLSSAEAAGQEGSVGREVDPGR